MHNFKFSKRLVSVILCALIISNNTLPVLAETDLFATKSELSIDTYDEEIEDKNVIEIEEPETDVIKNEVVENEILETDELEIEEPEMDVPESDEIETDEIKTDEIKTKESETNTVETNGTEKNIIDVNKVEIEFLDENESQIKETIIESKETTTEETESVDKEIKLSTNSEIINSNDIKEETEEIIEEKIATLSEIENVNINEEIKIATLSEIEEALDYLSTPSEIIIEEVLSTEEILSTGFIKEEIEAPIVSYIPSENILYGSGALPSAYDSREQINGSTGLSYISPVRDQDKFGSCWAFSTIAMFESSLRVKGLVKTNSESDLSEAALCYYTYGLEDITNNSNYIDSPGLEGHDFTKVKNGNFANRGGNQIIALLASSAYTGVLTENTDTSYSRLLQFVGKEKEYSLNNNYAFKRNNFVLENAYIINKANIDIVKQKIIENGAVGISYFAGQSTLNTAGGDDAYMHKNGSEYYYFTNLSSDYANHAIAVVGWDDNIPKENFYFTNNGVTYRAKNPGGWLCRNSWGSDYKLSNGGYFWMSYEEPSLNTNVYAVDAIKSGEYKYNYHYDTTGYPASIGESASSTAPAAFANIFKVPNGEAHLLEAANVAINSTNTVLTVDVYTNDKEMTSPSDGTLKSTVTVERQTSGIFTIPLKDKVLLNGGTYFSIIIRGYSKNTNTKNLYIYYDTCGSIENLGEDINNPISFYNAAETGQSFYTTYRPSSKTYDSWSDLNPGVFSLPGYANDTFGTNYRIKGLANPVVTVKISFDSDGGDGTMNDLNVLKAVATPLPKNVFTKKGYKFEKWVDQYGEEYVDQATIDTESNLTLKAVWTPIKYRLRYKANGGTISIYTVYKIYGQSISLETPIRNGYKFAGWYRETSFINMYDGNTDIEEKENASVYLYAKWIPISYTINYELNGVKAVRPSSILKTYYSNVKLSDPLYPPSGYKFAGWYKDVALKYIYDGKSDLMNVEGEVSIYAKWKVHLTYNSNGRGNAPTEVYVYKDENVMLPVISAVSGYTFDGWYKEADCITKISDGGKYYKVSEPETIYAKWNKNPIAPSSNNENNQNNNAKPSTNNNTANTSNTNNIGSGGSSRGGGGSSSGGGSGSGGSIGNRGNSNVLLDNSGPVSQIKSEDKSKTKVNINRAVTNIYNRSSAQWSSNDDTGKWSLSIKNNDGSIDKLKNGFVQLDGYRSFVENNQQKEVFASDTYFFDEEGNMVTGWVQTSEDKWYYFNTENTSELGKMAFGWTAIDGAWYFFALEGALYKNTTTPDGFRVDENGKLIS